MHDRRPPSSPPPPGSDGPAPEPGPGASDGQDAPDASSERSTAVRVLKWIGLVVGGLVALVLVLVLALLLALQTNWGGKRVADAVLGLVDPFDNAELQIGRIEGTWLTNLRLYDVALVQDDTTRLAAVDTLRLRYDLLGLLNKEVRVQEAFASGLDVRMTQQADSTWDLLNTLRQDTTTVAADTSSSGFGFRVDDLRLVNTRLSARFYAPGRDSVFRVPNLELQADDLVLGPDTTLGLTLRRLDGRFVPPGQTYTVDLLAQGALRDSRLVVDTLSLQSPRSDVTATGSLRLPLVQDEPIQDIDFRLDADPLAFADIQPFVQALNPEATARLDLRAQGSLDRLDLAADGAFGDGATFDLEGTVTPSTEGPVAYRLDAQVRRLDPGYLTAGPSETPVLVNADLTADLQGTTLEALAGRAQATVFDSRFGDFAPARTVVEARFQDGTARLDGRTGLRGADLALEGTVTPFAEPPTYDLSGQVAGLDVGRFAEDGTATSDVTAFFEVEGRGFAPDEAVVSASLNLAPSRVNQYQIQDGQVDVRLADGTVDLDADLTFPEGGVAVAGEVVLPAGPDDELAYRIDQGRLDNVDVAALAGDTLSSSINATFSLQGRGTDPATLRLREARFDVAQSFYGPYQIQSASGTASLQNGRLGLRANASLEGGAFDVTGSGRPFAATPTFTVDQAYFEEVELGTLLQNPDLSTDLNGSLTADIRRFDVEEMVATARIELVDSRYNEQPIESGFVDARLERGALRYDARLDTPDGLLAVDGSAQDLFSDSPTFALEQGDFRRVDVGRLLGNPNLSTDLNFTLRAEGRGLSPDSLLADATLAFDRSRINDATILGGTVDVQTEDGFTRLGANLDLEEGGLRLSASGRLFDDIPTYEAEGTLDGINLGAFLGVDTLDAALSGSFDVEGRGTDPRTLSLDATVRASDARYDSVRVDDLIADLRLDDGLLQVDSLRLASNVATARASGTLALFDSTAASDFRLDATITSLAPVRPFVGADVLSLGEGTVELRAYGRPGTVQFDAEAELTSLVYNTIRLAGADVRLAGTLEDGLSLARAEATGELDYASIPTLTARNTDFEVTYDGDEIGFRTDLTVDETRDARLAGRVDLRPDNRRVLIEDLGLGFGEDQWELLQEATISYGDEYRVSNFLIFADDQQIALDGVVDLDGTQSLILTIENFRTGAVADLLGFEGLGGTLYGSVDLTGPAEAPNVDGDLRFDVQSGGEAVGDLALDVRYDSLRLNVDARLAHVDSSTLVLAGYIPVDLRLSEPSPDAAGQGALQITAPGELDGNVDLQLQADGFSIGWVEPFLDPETVSRVEGALTADVRIGGSLDRPVLDGTAYLADGLLDLPQIEVTYTDVEADVELDGSQALVNHIELHTGDGTLVGDGSVDFADLTLGAFNLDASLEEFRLIDTGEYRIVSGGDVQLSGTTERPVLTGQLDILSADIFLTEETTAEEFAPVELTEDDLQMLERRFGVRVAEEDTTTFDFYANLRMDLSVDLERDVWLRSTANPDMNIQFTGDLDLSKEAGGEQQLFGVIEVIPQRSYINQFGRRFNITSGTLTFNGPATLPRLDVEAEYEVRSRGNQGEEITILLSLEGTPEDLTTQLSSDPPTDLTNIVSYIATGRPASQAFQLGGEGTLAGRGADLALGQVANIVENAAGSELGLDVIEIRQQGLEGATITAGKYLTRRLYVSVSQPISFNDGGPQEAGTAPQRIVAIEYELFEWLLARVASEGESSVRINLLWEYAY